MSIKATRAEEGWVKNIGAIGGSHDDNVGIGIEAVHLCQNLIERLLSLIVSTAQASTTVSTYSINFINKYKAW
jgi:hypothetical protein